MKRRLILVLAAWLVLLAASHLVRYVRPASTAVVAPPDRSIETPSIGADGSPGRSIRLVFRDEGPQDGAVILLLHGSRPPGGERYPGGR